MNQREIILRAASIGTSSERARFLDDACGDNRQLRERIESLLSEEDCQATDDAHNLQVDMTIGFTLKDDLSGTMIGRYKLMEKIGEGGMGVIYVAEQHDPVRRRVAIKIIKPGMDTQEVMVRFDAERQALAMMDHPNIARVLDAGATDTGKPFFVMELVRGIPITKFCDNNKLSSHQRLDLFVDVCHAIQHAHQKGIIHRDVKPNNVLVTSHDGKAVVKVIDFGVAKAINQRLTEFTVYTKFSQMVGTPLYMSPEQAEMSGLDIDTRSDIYSLGVLLYELLTGDTPFDRKRMLQAAYDEMRRIIREEDPPRPSTRISTLGDTAASVSQSRGTDPRNLSNQLRGDLDWIVMKAMEKDRTRRYETANGLAMDVQRFLNDEPVLASPPSTSYRLKKLIRRNRGAFVAAAISTVLLVAGVAGTTYGMVAALRANKTIRRQNAELDQSNRNLTEANISIQEKHTQLALARDQEAEARQRAEGVKEFLVSAFRRVDPDQDGYKLTVVELLDRSVEDIEKDLESAPDTQADLLSAIGRSYRGLGMHAEALSVFQRVHELRAQINEPEDRLRLLAAYNYALALYYDGKYQAAIELSKATLETQRKALGEDHTETLSTMNTLAMCYAAIGESKEALELYRTVAQTRREKEGEDDPDTLTAVNNLASAYQTDGQLERALSLLTGNLEKRLQIQGEDHRMTLLAMDRLGSIYIALGNAEMALPLYQKALDKRRTHLGDSHPETLESMSGLGFALRDAGRLDDALNMLDLVLRSKREKLGNKHHSTIASMNNLARIHLELGRYSDALPLVKESFEESRDMLGATSPKTVAAMNTLGMTYFLAGNSAEALPVFEELLGIHLRNHGEDNLTTITVMNNLAMTYRDAGRLQDALPLFEKTLELRKRLLDSDHPKTLVSQANLASIYASLGQLDKAIELSEETVKSHQAKLGRVHRQTISAMIGLSNAYTERGELRQGVALAPNRLHCRNRLWGTITPIRPGP